MGGTNRAPVPGWGGNLPPYSGIVTKNALAVLPGEGTLPTDAPQSWGPGSPRSRRSAPSPQNTCMLVGCGRSAVGRRPSWQFEGLRGEGGHGRSSLVRRQQSCEVTATPLHLSFHGVRTASQSPATFSEKQQGKSRIGSIGLAEGGGIVSARKFGHEGQSGFRERPTDFKISNEREPTAQPTLFLDFDPFVYTGMALTWHQT